METLEEFKKRVSHTAMAWGGGCEQGKVEFLRGLGIDTPTKKIQITYDIEIPAGGVNHGDLCDSIRNEALERDNVISMKCINRSHTVKEQDNG